MTESSTATIESPPSHARVDEGPFACIDMNRFCDGCGYNLRALAVYRDERIGIPLVRCPECGQYQSANEASTALRPWLQRATSLLLWVWILAAIALLIFLGIAEGGISYATLDEMTIRGGTSTKVTQIGNTITRTWSSSYGPLEIWTDFPYYELFVGSVLAGSFSIAFVTGLLAVVIFPHWRRVAYTLLVLCMPIVAASQVAFIWNEEAAHLLNWGLRFITAHAGAQMLGGMVGILVGRPLARLIVRIVLPPTLRPRLAYLWLADGLPTPR